MAILALLGDDDVVRRRLQGALDSQVRGFFTHEANEIPVLDSGGAVSQHVANELRVDLGGGVETNCGLEVVVVDVSIDGGWDADDTGRRIVGLEEFSQVESISHGSSGTDNNKTGKVVSACNLESLLLLLISSEFISTSADIVISTKVDVEFEVFAGHHFAVVGHETIDTVDEANKLNIVALGLVSEKTINDVVASRSLTSHEDKTNFLGSFFVNIKHLSIERRELSRSAISESSVRQKIVLKFNEVVGFRA